MKTKSIAIGMVLSAVLVVTAAVLYWMANQARAGEHYLAISTVRRIQQLDSQWSIETARVRSDPLADFDSLAQFIPRMERLKRTLSDVIRNTPGLPDRLANTTGAYLSALAAKEERIERFKTGYAVLRNSVRYLPLAATNVMQQMQARGANSAFIKHVATITEEINNYLASPAAPEKERLIRMLDDLGDGIATRHPVLVNTAMNFVAHGQVLLDKQAPTEEIFLEATSDSVSGLGETIIKSLESEIDRAEALAAWYERGIVGTGVVLWVMWLAIAFKMPAGKDRTRRGGAPQLPNNPLVLRHQAGPGPDGDLGRLTADLIKTEAPNPEKSNSTAAAEFAAYQIGVDIAADRLMALAERINNGLEVLNDKPAADAGTPSNEDRDAVAAVVASIQTQANDIVELAKRLPALGPKRDEGYAQLDLNDYIDEVTDSMQAKIHSLIIKELNPIPTVPASEADVYLMVANVMENAALAIQDRGQKKGIIRVETRHRKTKALRSLSRTTGSASSPRAARRSFTHSTRPERGRWGWGSRSPNIWWRNIVAPS